MLYPLSYEGGTSARTSAFRSARKAPTPYDECSRDNYRTHLTHVT